MKNVVRIVSTRKLEESVKSLAMKQGIYIEEEEFLSIRYSEEKSIAEEIQTASVPLVFTSQHAVKAIAGLIGDTSLRTLQKQCFCLDGATKEQAILWGFDVIGEASDAAALASRMIQNGVKEILFLSGDLRREELTDRLKEHSVHIRERVVYHKFLTPKEINYDYQGVMFFSPSQIEAFLQRNTLNTKIPAFCIGKTTGRHLEEKGHQNIQMAGKSNTESMLKKIYEYFK